ncbi:MBL fold metallo-hydrolase [Rhodobacterales bacterium 52_120_T64]|nr:MBL fold metallo-hydrolase [Rhodobacterales bacterium 52_120_T64]
MGTKLTFLGGAGTVTGSKYLLETQRSKILIDCGLFQGHKELRLRNWQTFPIEPRGLDAVVLTHAHLDHTGYLPALIRNGFKGPVFATSATKDLCAVLLPDSGYLQEREAYLANKYRYSRHKPAKPLYTKEEATECLKQIVPMEFNEDNNILKDVNIRFSPAGHILGAATVQVSMDGTNILFSGDLGRPDDPVLVAPAPIHTADYLIVESTYGNRLHEDLDVDDEIAKLVVRVAGRGGTILIPSFAVGRAQSLLFYIQRLKAANKIPDLPVFLDSPMAINASDIFCEHQSEHRLSVEQCRDTCAVATYVRTVDESKAIGVSPMPKIIISASGMATGGRILHHIVSYGSDSRNAILFAGYQAAGTRGEKITGGASSVKIFGRQIPIRAEVTNLHALSAHADANEIMTWLGNFKLPPNRTFITHGEPKASGALRQRIEEELNWECNIPEYGDNVDLE